MDSKYHYYPSLLFEESIAYLITSCYWYGTDCS